MGPKTGAQKSIPASLFPFLDRGNYSRGSKKQGPCHKQGSGSAQAQLRFAHLQLRLIQQLLKSKDGNGNCSCQDSDVECPVSLASQISDWPRAYHFLPNMPKKSPRF
jgi:hypothetical protein